MAPITSSGSTFTGMATSASAMMGLPPMAYTSDSALVAAMRPNSYGSSTMGMKKSVVATSAWLSFRRYTAASSEVSMPTINSGGMTAPAPLCCRICDSTPGAILQPQPPPCDSEVRRGWEGAAVGAEAFMANREKAR